MTSKSRGGYRAIVAFLALGAIALSPILVLPTLLAAPAQAQAQQEPARSDGGALWGVRKERVSPAERRKSSSRRHTFGSGVRRESFLRYQVVGGADGGERELVVRGDGTVKYRDEDGVAKQGNLTAPALRQLIKQFATFEELDPVYGSKSTDPFQRTVTLVRRVAKGERRSSTGTMIERPRDEAETVTIYDSPDLVLPRALTKMVEGLERLIQNRLTESAEVKVEFRGIAAAAMIDRYVYALTLDERPIPAEMWVHLSVANLTDNPFELRFETSQLYEITIESVDDSSDPFVWHWSEGRRFEEKERTMRVARDTLSWVERIPLADAAGTPFPPGEYRLAYEILSEPAFRGEAPFRIEARAPRAKKEDFRSLLADYRETQTRSASSKTGSTGGKSSGKAAKDKSAKRAKAKGAGGR